MIEVSVYAAKTQLSKLLTRVASGEEVTISRHGQPTAKLVPIRPASVARKGGKDRGLFQIPDNFDEEVPELNRLFEG